MKRMPFERPTDYYDERLFSIDKELCALLKQRKEQCNNNPGFPPFEYITEWAKKYGLYEDFLKSLFGALRNEEHFRPHVEPEGFRKYIPIQKSMEKGDCFYSVTMVRQYANASVINFNMDWDATNESQGHRLHTHHFFALFLGEQYDCRMGDGSGSAGHHSYNFIVSPPLPDDMSGMDLIFREYSTPFMDKPTGLEIVMHLE